jgi:hypothetical protein
MRSAYAVVLLALIASCGDDDVAPDAAPPARELTLTAAVDDSGLSPAVTFEIPEGTRSITIVVEGATDGLYALGSLSLGDGLELVGLPAGNPGPAMQAAYNVEQIGQMEGELYQSIRLGTYTHVYPYRPGQAVVAGSASLRVASDRSGPVTITVLMPEEDGAATLPLNLYLVSDTLAEPDADAFTAELDRIFAQAGITVRINGVERLTGTAFERITQSTEPQEAPDSQSAMLPALVADRETTGLDIFLVETLPSGIGGLSLGTPGPPLKGSYYFGVLVLGGVAPVEMARIVAHEGAHFLALQHVQNVGVSGTTYPDPLDDTTPGADNLMEDGTVLTEDQAFALTRSALLE